MDYDRIILEMLDRIQLLEERVSRLEEQDPPLEEDPAALLSDGFQGKYQALSSYLAKQSEPSICLSFEEIEEIIGLPLPPSAYQYRAFWSNTKTHSVSQGWLQAGFETTEVNLQKQYVVFTRENQFFNKAEQDINSIWKNIQLHVGEEFVTKTGTSFTYSLPNTYTLVTSNTSMPLTKTNFAKALKMMPVRGPGGFGQKIQGPSYVFALLTDPRIIH